MTTAEDDQQCELPAGWQLHDPRWGFMGVDNTPAGRVVRLADVLLHLERARGLPRGDALAALLDGIENAGASLVVLSKTQAARPVGETDRFGFPSRAIPVRQSLDSVAYGSPEWRREFQRLQSGTGPGYSVKHVNQVQPGLSALKARLRQDWLNRGHALDDEKTRSAWLGILLCKARELWGFGGQAEKPAAQVLSVISTKPPDDSTGWLALVERYKQHKAREGAGPYQWRDEERIAAFLEEKRLKKAQPGSATKKMAKDLDISPQALRGHINHGKTLHEEQERRAKMEACRGNSVFNR